MRYVAIALAALTMTCAFPAMAAQENPWDECGTVIHANPSQGVTQKPCHDQTIDPAAPGAPSGRYYVYFAAAKCAPDMKSECTGRVNDDHPAPTAPILGTVYEETNKYSGLQRQDQVIDLVFYKADRMLLV